MCIICFLKDELQYELRNSSQIRSDRFEHTINKYRQAFLRVYEDSINSFCDKHDNERNREINSALKDINLRDINEFFKSLMEVYVLWINSELGESIEKFIDILDKYNIMSGFEQIDDKVLFRGRRSSAFISHWDMFHIPFNKRFNIGNQRYSLVGQPLLYLGTSPYCVYRELGTYENLRLSSFRFKSGTGKKVFNNSNLFYKYIEENDSKDTMELIDSMIEGIDNIDSKEIIKNFFLLIVSSCCSFQRRSELKETNFCEEYVLPQILAQITKKKCDGIMYTSTKAYYDENLLGNEKLMNLIYKNICIFTNYNKDRAKDVTYVYDKELYEQFILSAPISIDKSLDEKYYDLKETLKIIQNLFNENRLKAEHKEIVYGINEMLIEYSDSKEGLENKDNNKNNIGQEELLLALNLHSLLLRNIILNIVEEIKEDEFENE